MELRDAELHVPLYARGGSFTVAPEVAWSQLADPAQAVAVTLHARQPGETVAEVKLHGGVPTLFINGRPHSGMSYMTYRPNGKYFGQFGQLGVHLYSFSATPTEAAYGLAKTCWVAPEEFDYSGFEERVKMLLDADPDAYFFPRLYLLVAALVGREASRRPGDLRPGRRPAAALLPLAGRQARAFVGLGERGVATRRPRCGGSSSTSSIRPMPTAWWATILPREPPKNG